VFERLNSKSAIDHSTVARVSVTRTGVKIGVNKPFYRAMFEHSSDLVIPFEGDVDTLLHAVLERGLFVKTAGGFSHRPAPMAGASFEPFLAAYRDVACATARLNDEAFLATRPSRLRKVYALAQSRNRTDWFDIGKEAVTSGFVKVEKTKQACGNIFSGGETKIPVPRLINPRSTRFNAKLGMYTLACEHTIYKNIGEMFGKPCIAKGMNMAARASNLRDQWTSMEDPVGLSMDASRFDQHTGKLPFEFEHALLRLHFPGDKLLKWLQRVQLHNLMYGRMPDGKVMAELLDMRMSGDMNTALGNCVITAALIWLRLQLLNVNAYAMVDGDDSVLIMERRDYAKYKEGAHEFFLQFGYNMEIEAPVDVFEQIDFCQTSPVWVGDHWRMVRNPRKALNNDYAGYQKCADIGYVKSLFYSIGSAGLSLCSGVPVIRRSMSGACAKGPRPARVSSWRCSFMAGITWPRWRARRRAAPLQRSCACHFRLHFTFLRPRKWHSSRNLLLSSLIGGCSRPRVKTKKYYHIVRCPSHRNQFEGSPTTPSQTTLYSLYDAYEDYYRDLRKERSVSDHYDPC